MEEATNHILAKAYAPDFPNAIPKWLVEVL